MAECFGKAGTKLKTLRLCYTSSFGGEIDGTRDAIEGPLNPNLSERIIMLRDIYGKYHGVKRSEVQEKLFKYCKLLEPLRKLRNIAEFVLVRGDLSQAYIDELTVILSSSEQSARIKKQQAEAKKTREEQRKPLSFQEVMGDIAEKNKHDPNQKGKVQLAQQCMRVPAKSPAVMAELMKPPSQASLQRHRERMDAERQAQASQQENPVNASSSAGEQDVGRSVGVG